MLKEVDKAYKLYTSAMRCFVMCSDQRLPVDTSKASMEGVAILVYGGPHALCTMKRALQDLARSANLVEVRRTRRVGVSGCLGST